MPGVTAAWSMRPSIVHLVLVLGWAPAACHSPETGKTHGTSADDKGVRVETTSPSGVATSPSADPTARASEAPLTAKLARCGWGAASTSAAPEAPPWAIALVDVDLPTDVKGLHVTALELGTEHGVVAKMGNRATLRFQEGAVSFSYGATDTHEVADTLTAGPVRLRVAAALDRPRSGLGPRMPTTCSVALTDGRGKSLVASGGVDPEWKNE
jgi:hypothetical protein